MKRRPPPKPDFPHKTGSKNYLSKHWNSEQKINTILQIRTKDRGIVKPKDELNMESKSQNKAKHNT